MMMMVLPISIAILIPIALMSIMASLTMMSFLPWKDRETSSPFECGFTPVSNARIPFSLRFFLLAVLFLIFDLEIIILIPSPMVINFLPMTMFLSPFMMFLIIVTMGLFHEWNEGSLDWMQ